MVIEKLNRSDLEQYKYLIDECFVSSNELEYYMEKYSENASYDILVAKEDEKIIGSVTVYKIESFTYSFQPSLELFNVAVLKEYRGKHVAKELFNYIIQYAKDRGYKSIYLNCLNSATNAHKLYESMGFKRADSVKYSLDI